MTTARWLALALGYLVLTVAALVVHFSDFWVPHWVSVTLERFASFGEFACWATIGGVFSGCPSTLAGNSFLVAANTVWWMGVSLGLWFVVKVLRRRWS